MPTYDQSFWEDLWSKTLREHPEKLTNRSPNAHLLREVASLAPGRALDAGCGEGAETRWLAMRGFQVTAVDFSKSALAQARATTNALGDEIASRVMWVEGDLATWAPKPEHYDLVVSLYVHIAGSVEEMVRRMASGVAVGGTLFMLGHRAVDALVMGQTQVAIANVKAALDANHWEFVVAEERPHPHMAGVDSVIHARRIASGREA